MNINLRLNWSHKESGRFRKALRPEVDKVMEENQDISLEKLADILREQRGRMSIQTIRDRYYHNIRVKGQKRRQEEKEIKGE